MVGAPRASQKVNDMLATLQVRSLAVTVKPGVFIENFHGMILYAESMDTQSDDLKNVFLYDERDNRMPMIVMGRRVDSLQQGEDHMQLTFHDGEIHVNRRDGSYQRVLFDDYRISIPVDLSEQKGIRSTLSMTQDELREEMKQLGSGHPFGSELRARYISFMLEYKRRFTIPLIPMIFVVLGTLWGCGHYRNMRGRPILISLIMSIGYWSIFLLVDGYARKETIPVNIAIWLPNIICILFCYQIFRVRRIYV
jgi:lipopolysaccharide export system permease protein